MGVSMTPKRDQSLLCCLEIHSSWLQELSVIPRSRDSEQSTGEVPLVQSPLSKRMKEANPRYYSTGSRALMKHLLRCQARLSQWRTSTTVGQSMKLGPSGHWLTQASSASSDHRYLRRNGFALGLGFRRALPWHSLAFYLCWSSYYCKLPGFASSGQEELGGQHVPLIFQGANAGN